MKGISIIAAASCLLLTLAGMQQVSAETLARVEKTRIQSWAHGLTLWKDNIYMTDGSTGLVKQISADQTLSTLISSDQHGFKGIAADDAGTLYLADEKNHAIYQLSRDGKIALLAGQGSAGFADGKATEAKFHGPGDVALGPDGAIYVADTLNHRIRKIDKHGMVSTVAGTGEEKDEDGWLIGGYRDGEAAHARINEPSSLAFDKQGHLYIADTGNQRIRVLTPKGTVKTIAGSGLDTAEGRYIIGGFLDGTAAEAKFHSPLGIAVSDNGTIYVADTWNHRIRAITPQGMVTTVAGGDDHGDRDSWGSDALFDGPTDVVVKPNGSLLVSDRWNRAVREINMLDLPDIADQKDVRMIVGEKYLKLRHRPFIEKGHVYVPLREFAEALQYKVSYEAHSGRITLQKDNVQTTVPNQKIKLVYQTAMIQVREISSILNCEVTWIPIYRIIVISPK